jgi:hypothetical protein
MTWVERLNFYFLQRLGVRLARQCELSGEKWTQTHWSLIGPLLPMSGWRNDGRSINAGYIGRVKPIIHIPCAHREIVIEKDWWE